MKTRHKIYWVLITLLLLFVTPLVIAWYFYHSHILYGTVNHGQLIQPPVSISSLHLQNTDATQPPISKLKGYWVMLYVNPMICDKTCAKNLYDMRQVRVALDKDSNRVQRVIVTTNQFYDPFIDIYIHHDYIGTLHYTMSADAYKQFVKEANVQINDNSNAALYIVDPQGNIMMIYQTDASPEDMLKDFTRLLGVSEIG